MAVSRLYPWKRFWIPFGERFALDEDGFLLDPKPIPRWIYASVALESLREVPCLVLLGEPGMGKSTALEAASAELLATLEHPADRAIGYDLREYGSEDRLVREVFASPEIQAWQRGSHRLHLFLDSLDECRLKISHVAALLLSELRKTRDHLPRLNLRIACRIAEWPEQLANELPELWGNESVRVLELAPLRRADVVTAAQSEGLADPQAFLDEVADRGVQALAARPVTLKFLLGLKRAQKVLTARRSDLFSAGCLQLATEVSPSRRDARAVGKLRPAERLALAERLAAVLVFCNRAAIDVSVGPTTSPDDCSLADLCGGDVVVGGDRVRVGEEELREVLNTGLFSGRGHQRLSFAHQTYAEFLAAKYLMDRRLTPKQMLALICHPADPEAGVVPQLAETAACLAGMNREVFEGMLRLSPQVLLRSDVAQASDEDRAKLVGRLLELFEQDLLLDNDRSFRQNYKRLRHPGLADQLRPFLHQPHERGLVRRVAIEIAGACRLHGLEADLLAIALDQGEHQTTREIAAFELAKFADSETRARLVPLALGAAGDDPEDQLRGAGLQATWPEHLTVDQLFGALTRPKRMNFFGFYRYFTDSVLPKNLRPQDLPRGLQWISELSQGENAELAFEELCGDLLVEALRHSELPPILERLATLLTCESYTVKRAYKHRREAAELLANAQLRRRLLQAAMQRGVDLEQRVTALRFGDPALVWKDDLEWFLQQVEESEGTAAAARWAKLASSVFVVNDACHSELVLAAAQRLPAVGVEFRSWIEPVELTSSRADEERKCLERLSSLITPQPAGLPMQEILDRVENLLDRFEAGDVDAWWELTYELTLDEVGRYYRNEMNSLLTERPGWHRSNARTRERILNAAREYLLARDARPQLWLGTNTWHRPAFSGYQALHLLWTEWPESLQALPTDAWVRWAPIVVAYPSPVQELRRAQPHLALIATTYNKAPEPFLATLMQLLRAEVEKDTYLTVLERLKACWDSRMVQRLDEVLTWPTICPTPLRELLTALLGHGSGEAADFATRILSSQIERDGTERAKAQSVAVAFMTSSPSRGWRACQPAFDVDPAFGCEVLENLEGRRWRDRVMGAPEGLTEAELADMFLFLSAHVPTNEDPAPDEAHILTPRESVGHLRDSLLQDLRDRGTPEAVQQLQRIASERPEISYLKFTVLAARDQALRQTWIPPSPGALLQLVEDSNRLLIRSAAELLEAVLASLERLQESLQGKPPAAPDLWDRDRPKDEGHLSDYVKRHLDHDLKGRGIVALREVQIERGQGTDVHVTGLVPGVRTDEWEPVSLVVEVKGQWHDEVRTAMQTQLVDRYLANSTHRHGIYLVGWFRCNSWSSDDHRSRAHVTWAHDAARQELEAQAADLSRGDVTVRTFVLDARRRERA